LEFCIYIPPNYPNTPTSTPPYRAYKYTYKKQVILSDLNGEAHTGQLVAVLGPTGCGKSSLLNVLAARTSLGGGGKCSLTGSVKVNGRPRDEDTFRRVSAYVTQDDQLYPHLTVTETLTLAAHFFLSSQLDETDKRYVIHYTPYSILYTIYYILYTLLSYTLYSIFFC
jgi:ABC-type multidrug transport system ATPase subunit